MGNILDYAIVSGQMAGWILSGPIDVSSHVRFDRVWRRPLLP